MLSTIRKAHGFLELSQERSPSIGSILLSHLHVKLEAELEAQWEAAGNHHCQDKSQGEMEGVSERCKAGWSENGGALKKDVGPTSKSIDTQTLGAQIQGKLAELAQHLNLDLEDRNLQFSKVKFYSPTGKLVEI